MVAAAAFGDMIINGLTGIENDTQVVGKIMKCIGLQVMCGARVRRCTVRFPAGDTNRYRRGDVADIFGRHVCPECLYGTE